MGSRLYRETAGGVHVAVSTAEIAGAAKVAMNGRVVTTLQSAGALIPAAGTRSKAAPAA